MLRHHNHKIAARVNARRTLDAIEGSSAQSQLDLIHEKDREILASRDLCQASIKRASKLKAESSNLKHRAQKLAEDCGAVLTTTSQILRAMRKMQCKQRIRMLSLTGPTKKALCAAMDNLVVTVRSNSNLHRDHRLLAESLSVHVAKAQSVQIAHDQGVSWYTSLFGRFIDV